MLNNEESIYAIAEKSGTTIPSSLMVAIGIDPLFGCLVRRALSAKASALQQHLHVAGDYYTASDELFGAVDGASTILSGLRTDVTVGEHDLPGFMCIVREAIIALEHAYLAAAESLQTSSVAFAEVYVRRLSADAAFDDLVARAEAMTASQFITSPSTAATPLCS